MQSIRNLEYQQCRICYDSTNNLQLLTSFVESSPLMADKTYAQLLLEVCNINVRFFLNTFKYKNYSSMRTFYTFR